VTTRLGEELQGDRLTELQVIGSINLAHPALAEQADDPIPLGQHRARRKAGLVDGIGR